MDIQVIVTTWGSDEWRTQGALTALATSIDYRVRHYHLISPVSAGAARNEAVDYFDPKGWICFLDADDRLAPGYLEAMEAACEHERQLLTPALKLGDAEPGCLTDRDIIHGLNPCPIGTLIHREVFEAAGRFWDEPAWEDWSLFRRAVLVGAEIRFVPDAVYLASSDISGRNSTVTNPRKLRQDIVRSHLSWSLT